ncbi:MAG: GNAT family N-acetyltransferase [Prevotellaceae bacterium]|jgi:GNAT superfamily N-acetyltransferase|nr:GNAT family N-acetyltransferase [Prevotellaceae bacterium]
MILRTIRPSENAIVKQLIEDGIKEHFGDEFDENYHLDLNTLCTDYNKEGCRFLVLLIDESIAATGGLQKVDSTTAEIKRVSVKKEFRNRHLGSAIIKSLEEYAVLYNYRKIILETKADWVEAKKFYAHNGYIEKYTSENGWTYFEKIIE